MRTQQPRLAWVVWGFAVFAYLIAIINRSSFSSLGIEAQGHFGIESTMLSVFMVIQLLVYAGCQIPVGLLLDRYGASAIIVTGGICMAIGQALMATVSDLWLVILARVLVGIGDACTFICVIRMLAEWFPVRMLPIVSQLTGQVGQAGQIISVFPLSFAVGTFGWMSGFLGLSAVGLLASLLCFFVLRDAPKQPTLFERSRRERGSTRFGGGASQAMVAAAVTGPIPVITGPIAIQSNAVRQPLFTVLLSLLRIPGVRLAYWLHFSAAFSMHVFILLWGTPFLVGGMKLSVDTAASVLTTSVVASMAAGLLLGPLTSRFAQHRVFIIFSYVLTLLIVWSAVLLYPGIAPLWLLVVLAACVGIGWPASMVSFEVLRSHAPQQQLGIATGLINTAAYTASLISIFLVGLLLAVQGAGSPENYTTETFKVAMSVQVPFLILGLTFMLIEWRRTKSAMGR